MIALYCDLQVLSTEQRQVLEKRGGAVLSRRSILKTAAPRPTDMEANALRVTGIADIRYWYSCTVVYRFAGRKSAGTLQHVSCSEAESAVME